MTDTRLRSLAKGLCWRLVAFALTGLFAGLVTGDASVGLLVGLVDSLAKVALFYLHERAWISLRWGQRAPEGCVVWFTGLPCSGKTTIAEELAALLRARGRCVVRIDGDTVRDTLATGERVGLCSDLGFSRADRKENLRRQREAAWLASQGGAVALVSAITPYEETRRKARERLGRLLLVYVSTSADRCEARDVKGMWARARAGEISDFTGIDGVYEVPTTADLELDTKGTIAAAADAVLREIDRKGWS